MNTPIRNLAAILAADMAGYSRLMGEDEARTLAALRVLRNETFEPLIAEHRGQVVKRMGDGWLVEFASVVDAVNCAIQLQERLADHDVIKLRMGIHIGDIVHEDEDIYGDGVNIAARLQDLSSPGCVLISEDVRRQLDSKRKQDFAELGERALKNIAEPTAVSIWPPSAVHEQAAGEAAPGGGKSTVTVTDFTGRGEDELTAQGITDDVTTALSRQTGLDYVLNEEDAGYVVEGNIRSAGGRCRVLAKLIDRIDKKQIWAEQFEVGTSDPFEVQDVCVYPIATAVRTQIWLREGQKSSNRNVEDLTVEEMLSLGAYKFLQLTVDSWNSIRPLMERVLDKDPDNFMALAMATMSATAEATLGYGTMEPEEVSWAQKYADRAQHLNSNSDFVYVVQSDIALYGRHNYDDAIISAERALEINPNYRVGFSTLAAAHALAGNYAQGIAAADRAMEAESQYPILQIPIRHKAFGYFGLADYREAAAHFARADRLSPGLPHNLMGLAASYWHLGDAENAKRAILKLLDAVPDIASRDVGFPPYREAAVFNRFRDGVIAAGLPKA